MIEYSLKIYVDDDYRYNVLLGHKNYNKQKVKIKSAQEIVNEVSK